MDRSLLAHAVLTWAACGGVMGVGMQRTTLPRALAIHAVLAPVFAAAATWSYYRRRPSARPFRTAAVLVGVIAALDLVIVAGIGQRSLAMFRSLPGTWLPFLLMFSASLGAGERARRGEMVPD